MRLFCDFLGLNAETPQVSYVKAIDVWMGACTAFIFSALLEFTVVNYLSRRRSGCCGAANVNTSSYHLRNGHQHCNQVLLLLQKCNYDFKGLNVTAFAKKMKAPLVTNVI